MNANYDYDNFFYDFIENHKEEDPNKLRLKRFKNDLKEEEIRFAITQIEGRQKAGKKIPSILKNNLFLFPSTLLAEQCTDERIAKIHGNLFKSAKNVLDLTAGLCIDSYYIALNGAKTTSLEIDAVSAEIARHNMASLNATVSVLNADANEYIKSNKNFYDGIFADPARRNKNNNRVYSLEDCSPNIIELIPYIKTQCKFLIVKASPMLDITALTNTVDDIEYIWVIGLKNECKEILFKINFERKVENIILNTINIINDDKIQEFKYVLNSHYPNLYNHKGPEIKEYLYEPNCCIMKAGCHYEVQNKFPNIYKISENSHLYCSPDLFTDFPGRIFIIIEVIPFKSKHIKDINKKYPQINVSTRNFVLSSDKLKAKLKVKDGGDFYLFGTTCSNNKSILVICRKIIF